MHWSGRYQGTAGEVQAKDVQAGLTTRVTRRTNGKGVRGEVPGEGGGGWFAMVVDGAVCPVSFKGLRT